MHTSPLVEAIEAPPAATEAMVLAAAEVLVVASRVEPGDLAMGLEQHQVSLTM